MLGRSDPAPARLLTMRRSPLLAALTAVALVLGLAACGQEDDPTAAEVRADLVEELQAYDAELSDDEAECVAEAIVEAVGVDELNDLDFSAEDPEDLDEEFGAAAVAARDDCLSGSTTSTTATTTSTSVPQ